MADGRLAARTANADGNAVLVPVTTKVRQPQSNGVVERLHRTMLDEHFRAEGRNTWFEAIEEMQLALNTWLVVYETKRPHQGRGMNGCTPLKAFKDGIRKTEKRR